MGNDLMLEALGMLPKREHKFDEDGNILVTVTAPAFMKAAPSTVKLSPEQFERYMLWRERKLMIQDALPELSADQREMLMSGLSNNDFHKVCGPEE